MCKQRLGFVVLLAVALVAPPVKSVEQTSGQNVRVSDTGNVVNVLVGNKPFTTYNYTEHKKPVFYPVYGPNQIPMTRNFPMKKVDGEANDHPHHKSIWLGHEINEIDFWGEKGGSVKLQSIKIDDSQTGFTAKHHWFKNESKVPVMRDQTSVTFSANEKARFLDYRVVFSTMQSKVVFEDTKEGFFAIRVHPDLRTAADSKRGVKKVHGKMLNSEKQSGKGIWGKRARWVCYHGAIDGKPCGVVFFDHPDNLRHPTTWHARDYGLLTANPFGLQHFEKEKQTKGDYTLEKGNSLSFKYRLMFFTGEARADQVELYFKRFAKR